MFYDKTQYKFKIKNEIVADIFEALDRRVVIADVVVVAVTLNVGTLQLLVWQHVVVVALAPVVFPATQLLVHAKK